MMRGTLASTYVVECARLLKYTMHANVGLVCGIRQGHGSPGGASL